MVENPYFQPVEIESYLWYRPGGYHPVHIGDTFKEGRYTVVHKLGHGTYSTVWLVWDGLSESLASLKIVVADASDVLSGTELDVLRRSAAGEGDGKRFVLRYLDSFTHQGPNGSHLCVVAEVSGPSLAECLFGYFPKYALPPEIARPFVWQAAKGVAYLHSCGIIHGDLHLGNFLYHLPALSNLRTQEDITKYFGELSVEVIETIPGMDPLQEYPHIPRYGVYPPDYTTFFAELLANPSLAQLKICDFGGSSLYDSAQFPDGIKKELICPRIHRAPEVIFDDLVSPASDIWALGNTIHQILTGAGTESGTLIPGHSGCSVSDVLCGMARVLGKFPERWWNTWKERSDYFDDAGSWIGGAGLEVVRGPLARRIRPGYIPGHDQEALSKILSGLFTYEPKHRWTAQELVNELSMVLGPPEAAIANL